MGMVSVEELNELARRAKTDTDSFTELYLKLGVEKRRFMHSVTSKGNHCVDAEVLFDDVFMDVVKTWAGTGNFIALFWIRLSSRRLDANRTEIRRLERQWRYCEFIHMFLNTTVDLEREVAFKEYVLSLGDKLSNAVQLIDDGNSLREVAVKLGYKSHNTLKAHLRKTYEQFCGGQ